MNVEVYLLTWKDAQNIVWSKKKKKTIKYV